MIIISVIMSKIINNKHAVLHFPAGSSSRVANDTTEPGAHAKANDC